MALTVVLLGLLAGCSLPENLGFEAVRAPEDRPWTVAEGPGWAVSVPQGTRVEAMDGELRVDAAEGWWWYDVRVVELAGPTDPMVTLQAWASTRCSPARWDLPAEPAPGVHAAGGFCSIDGRDHWMIASVEDRGSTRLLTGLIARRTAIPHEDAWVIFVDSALTATSTAAQAVALLSPSELRERLRTVQAARVGVDEVAQLPRPGGGTFTRDVHLDLAEPVWRARAAHPWPQLAPTP